jgi:Ni,Fe-hydrogenase I cytochrome b subunit
LSMIKDYLLYGKKDNHPNNNNNISNLIFGFCFLFLIIMVLGAAQC